MNLRQGLSLLLTTLSCFVVLSVEGLEAREKRDLGLPQSSSGGISSSNRNSNSNTNDNLEKTESSSNQSPLATRRQGAENEKQKRLVLFAGPHNTGSTSVEKFFYEYAAPFDRHSEDHKKTFGLRFWEWPRIQLLPEGYESEEEPWKVFQYLVTENSKNREVVGDILDGIKFAWEDADEGIIIGSEYFDQVGPNAEYDAVKAMKEIIKEVDAKDVSIVINYRAPRMDQWLSIGHHDPKHYPTYKEFMCDDNDDDGEQYKQQIQKLDTQMNPLLMAKTFVEAKLGHVYLMDLGGVDKAGKDIAHVIACDIMTGKCDDGWLRNHDQKVITDLPGYLEFEKDVLVEDDIAKAETLLRYRECSFAPFLANHNDFDVLHEDSIWHECDPASQQIYDKLLNSTIVFQTLKSQVTCPGEEVSAKKMKKKNNKKQPPQLIEKVLLGDFSAFDIPKHSNRTGFGSFVELILFPLVLIGVIGYQLHVMYQSQNPNTTSSSSTNARKERLSMTTGSTELPPVQSSSIMQESNYQDNNDDDDDDDDLDAEFGGLDDDEDDFEDEHAHTN